MRETNSKNYVSGLLTLMVFAVFAACIVFTLLTGAGIYKRIGERDNQSGSARTILQYITTRVRGAESPDAVSVETLNGKSVLSLRETVGEKEYRFFIYLADDGYMKELYAAADSKFYDGSGESLVQADELQFSLNNGLLSAEVTIPGQDPEHLYVNIRGKEPAL